MFEIGELCSLRMRELYCLAMSSNGDSLSKRVVGMADLCGFSPNEENKWAFHQLASFMDHGWDSLRSSVTIKEEYEVSHSEFGTIINCLVEGRRYDRKRAGIEHVPWVFEETHGRAAAFLFFVATEAPTIPACA